MPRDRIHRSLLVVVAVLIAATVAGIAALWPDAAREVAEPMEPLVAGEVADVALRQEAPDPLGGSSGLVMQLGVDLLDGPDAGQRLELVLAADGYPELRVGDRVALDRTTDATGAVQYHLRDIQRLPALAWLLGLFVVAVLVVSRWHGLRSLVGLGLSLLIVVRFVIPSILAGNPPPLVALVGAVAIMILTLYLAHGVNEKTTAAVLGTTVSLAATVALGSLFIGWSRITGYASGDLVFARAAIDGLDLGGMVLAGLIIASLGVLDDVTVSQSSTVFVLHETDRRLSWTALFTRAMRVGRDHIASVVNTLFLAYAGASIALLLLFATGGVPVLEILNAELLAVEIVKTLVGSLGLVLAVPLTTALAAWIAAAGGSRGADRDAPASTDRGREGAAGSDAGLAGDDEEERSRRAWAAYLARYEAAQAAADDAPGGPTTHSGEVPKTDG